MRLRLALALALALVLVLGLGAVTATLALGCTRPALVTSEEGHTLPVPDGAPASSADVRVAPAPMLAGTGPFYEPDRAGKPVPMLRNDAPSTWYAGLDRTTCLAEITRRGIAVEQAPETEDVVTPVWLRGPLRGVTVRSALSPKERLRSPAEIFDCRLVLAIDDFAALAAKHDVVEIVHLSAHRARADNGCTPKYRGLQHCAALALDVGSFKKKDGSVLKVERDFHGKIGQSTCAGIAKPKPPSAEATELWDLVCTAAAQGLFHVILTPNFNAQHKNHFHLEITPSAAWMLIH